MNSQDDLDYTNNAQMRVCADALLLHAQTTLTMLAGENFVTLPDDLIRMTGISVSAMPLPVVPRDRAIMLQSLPENAVVGDQGHYLLGRTLYLSPTPIQDTTITIAYIRRPAQMQSDDQLEISGQAEEAVRLRVLADTLTDDGQDEMAQLHEQLYQQAIRNVRRQSGQLASRLTFGSPLDGDLA